MARGRRTKYTPEVVEKVTFALALGASQRLACSYAGIGHDTFHRWRNEKSEFSEALCAARGRAAVRWLAQIERAAEAGHWRAAAWKLERRYPEDYGRRARNVHLGTDAAFTTALRELGRAAGQGPREG